jgi:hypothetical protein
MCCGVMRSAFVAGLTLRASRTSFLFLYSDGLLFLLSSCQPQQILRLMWRTTPETECAFHEQTNCFRTSSWLAESVPWALAQGI